MEEKKTLGRREMIKRGLMLTVVSATGAAALSACGGEEKKSLSCMDTSGLSPQEVTMRQAQKYVDASPHGVQKDCENCNFYDVAPAPDTCGGCKVIKGPIHPKGFCNLWAAKVTG